MGFLVQREFNIRWQYLLLITVHVYYPNSPINAHWVVWVYAIFLAFEGLTCTKWQAYLLRGIYQSFERYVYQCSWSHHWLYWVHMRHIYWYSCLICAHEVICICSIWGPFLLSAHIWLWHNKQKLLHTVVLTCICSNVVLAMYTRVLVQWDIYVWCGRHICSGAYANKVKYMYSSAPGCTVDYSKFIWSIYIYIDKVASYQCMN